MLKENFLCALDVDERSALQRDRGWARIRAGLHAPPSVKAVTRVLLQASPHTVCMEHFELKLPVRIW